MTERFTFFWRGTSPFSQWHMIGFTVDGSTYNCAEQFMMAGKARLFGDAKTEAKIMAAADPGKQKSLGRSVRPFELDIWNESARKIVYRGNHAKFTQNPLPMGRLLETRGTTLVEASPTDRIWGIGLAEEDPRALDRSTWLGTNWLGEVLTQLREDLIAEKDITASA